MLTLIGYQWITGRSAAPKEIPYSEFKTALTGGKVNNVLVGATQIDGKLRDGSAFTTVRIEDPNLTQILETQKVEFSGEVEKSVGGAGEAVTDLKEVTEFLKNPDHFQRLGGKMPKGVLLVGPPGTGKTLLARGTAGEASVQFFNPNLIQDPLLIP
ncbi:MAG: hypothetical protein A2Z16_17690 [Chloroflexi bacterium RBG_16_54_18]|nr:MAG: hypothetical protein A2Z16_17690 [Chloroflexi bacterium RBG_16_54_18]